MEALHRLDGYFDRPSNELVFIRSLGHVVQAFTLAYETEAEMKRRIAHRPEFLKRLVPPQETRRTRNEMPPAAKFEPARAT